MLSNYQQSSATLDRILRTISLGADLDAIEEIEVARRALSGDVEAAQRLVSANLRRVLHLARAFRHKGVPLEDLIHEGSIGLLEASRTFDLSRGVRFFTYAAFFVRRRLVAAIARGAKTVRIPRHVAARIQQQRHDRDAAGPLPGVPMHSTSQVVVHGTFEISTDERADPRRATTRGELLRDQTSPGPADELFAAEATSELRRALVSLPDRERLVLSRRFGLEGHEPQTLRELGDELCLSKERVRQLEDRAKATLRERIERRGRPS